MIRLSPLHAIYEGAISFKDVHSDVSVTNFVTFDTYHNDLRFKFDEFMFVYSVLSGTFVEATTCRAKQISRFFWQKVHDTVAELMYLSFLFQIGESWNDLRTYYVEGYLKEGEKDRMVFNNLNLN